MICVSNMAINLLILVEESPTFGADIILSGRLQKLFLCVAALRDLHTKLDASFVNPSEYACIRDEF